MQTTRIHHHEVPARNLIAIPTTVTDAQAVFVEPLAAACGVMERVAFEIATSPSIR